MADKEYRVEVIDAFIESNNVWVFECRWNNQSHIVKIGDYFTCTCYGSENCSALRFVLERVFHTEEISRNQLVHPNTLPPITCPICLVDERWQHRGVTFCFCKICLQPFHKSCIEQAIGHSVKRCPKCHTQISSMSAVFCLIEFMDSAIPKTTNKEPALDFEAMKKYCYEEAAKINWEKKSEELRLKLGKQADPEPSLFDIKLEEWVSQGNEEEDFFAESDDEELPSPVYDKPDPVFDYRPYIVP